ncbi:MAG: hypothetical protein Q7R30_18670 [Acidobacteriota bacterium]|nr:hypothetical protein [Acidobacteriota bacterium]
MKRTVAAAVFVGLTLAGSSCSGREGLAQRIVGKWDCFARENGGRRQTTWSAPCRAEYRANGTWYFTEDNIEETGTYQIFATEGAIFEEVSESGVKERVGYKSRSLVKFVADQMTITYEPDAQGRAASLTYLRSPR